MIEFPEITFTVARPCSINAHTRHTRTGVSYTTPKGREFSERIRVSAMQAKRRILWPDLDTILLAEVSYILYGCPRMDADAPAKIVRDALQGIFYHDDKIVEDGPHRFGEGSGPLLKLIKHAPELSVSVKILGMISQKKL